MIKTIAYFPSQCAINSGPAMSAVLDCLQSAKIQTQENSMTADAAVIWSVLWSGRMAANQQVYEHYRAQNKPVIIAEVGSLYRGNTWKVAVNNVTADGYYGHQEKLDWDRPKKLKISQAITISSNPDIVIVLQHARSLQVAGIDQAAWAQKQITELRKYTDRPICVRSHPRSVLRLPDDIAMQQPQKIPGTYDSFDLRFDCHAVINYNSSPGIQAAIAGCRPVVDASSLAHPVGIDMANIEIPYNINRDKWLVEICHTEYTVEELATGQWLKRIQSVL